MNNFKVIIVEDVPLELKGTEGIIRNDIPEAETIGTANNEAEYWRIIRDNQPDLILLDGGKGQVSAVKEVLENNKAERHLRGGMATREKYKSAREK